MGSRSSRYATDALAVLYRAAEALAQLRAEDVVIDGLAGRRVMRAGSRECFSESGRYPLGLHSHAIPELCLALEGRPALDMVDHRYDLHPPCLGILRAQVGHSEAYCRRDQPYVLLWLADMTPVNTRFLLSRYHGGGRWQTTPITETSTRLGRWLSANLVQGTPFTACQVAELRARLLGAVSRAILSLAVPAPQARIGYGRSNDFRSQALVQQVQRYLDQHLAQPACLRDLAALTGWTPNYLNSRFHQATGWTIHQYQQHWRMEQAMRLCREGRQLIKQIALQVGYEDPLYFSRAFHRYHGVRPSRALGREPGDTGVKRH